MRQMNERVLYTHTPPIYPKAQTRFNPVRRSVADGVCGLVSMGSKSMALQTVCVEHSGRVRRRGIAGRRNPSLRWVSGGAS
jgi:hypothetical protein